MQVTVCSAGECGGECVACKYGRATRARELYLECLAHLTFVAKRIRDGTEAEIPQGERDVIRWAEELTARPRQDGPKLDDLLQFTAQAAEVLATMEGSRPAVLAQWATRLLASAGR